MYFRIIIVVFFSGVWRVMWLPCCTGRAYALISVMIILLGIDELMTYGRWMTITSACALHFIDEELRRGPRICIMHVKK